MRRSLPLALLALALPFVILAVAVAATMQQAPAPTPVPTPPPVAATPSSTATPTPSPEPAAPPLPAAGPGLAVGLTEFNANLVASPATKELPPPWAGVRDALGAIKPAFFRLVIDWRSIQPTADQPANLDAPHTGCVRDVGPCLEFGGVRELLKALASRQAEGGWETLVVITDTPDWAAAPAGGCERESTQARNRPPRADALGAYRQLVADLLAAATQQGATLRYWSAWNEPNLPPFVSPQRAVCDTASPSLAPGVYAQIAEAMIGALDDAPGDQQLVIGETAGILRSTKLVTSAPEFIAGLPENIVCASTVYTQHAYVGGPDPVDAVAGALAKRKCAGEHTIWITETGVGPAPKEYSGIVDPTTGCRALHDRLVQWFEDPRVTVAFQYTFREDDKFPTGLYSTDLTTPRPALAEWIAWGGGRAPTAPPPPAAC